MINVMQQINYGYVSFIYLDNVDKNKQIAYNTCKKCTGDTMLDDDTGKNIFAPTEEQIKIARETIDKKLQEKPTKGFNKYIKKLIKSYSDLKIDG